MFENLVFQEAGKNLISDIKHDTLPGSILFSGNDASGKLTAALETARVLSCKERIKGNWLCNCSACTQQKALTYSNLMLLGSRDCFLEISAAKRTFLKALKEDASYLLATRYLFLRSIRKLTLRFNGILWQGESNLNKIGGLIQEINENLEMLDIGRDLPPYEQVEEICNTLEKICLDLETDYLYDSIPVNQIRNMEAWAHIKSEEGKKTIIIENADRMLSSVRNALLKILEEPPEDCVFILLTSKRNAMMQTILSRVRTYNFKDRTLEQQHDVITRVFHNFEYDGSISKYLLNFLPVSPDEIINQSNIYFDAIANRSIPEISEIVKTCDNFNPRIILKIFLQNILNRCKKFMYTQQGAEVCAKVIEAIRECQDNITLYNQTPISALETLLKKLTFLNVSNGGIFKN